MISVVCAATACSGVVAATGAIGTFLPLLVVTLVVGFLTLVRYPELAVAVQFNSTIIYFYALYRIGISPGRALTGAFYGYLAAGHFLGSLTLWARGRSSFSIGLLDGLVAALFVILFVSYTVVSVNNSDAYYKMAYAPLLIILPYGSIRLLAIRSRLRRFLGAAVAIPAVLIIPVAYELLLNRELSAVQRFSLYTFGDQDNPILFGLTYAVPFIITLVISMSRRERILGHLLFLQVCGYLVFRSGARGPVVSTLLASLLCLMFPGGLRIRTKVCTGLCVAAMAAWAYSALPDGTAYFLEYSFSEEARFDSGSSIHVRLEMWKEAWREFLANPIFGVGAGNSVGGGGFPHNILLEVSAELGLVGLFVFLSICFVAVQKAMVVIINAKDSELRLLMKIALALFVMSLAECMFSGYITQQTMMFMSAALIASVAQLPAARPSAIRRRQCEAEFPAGRRANQCAMQARGAQRGSGA